MKIIVFKYRLHLFIALLFLGIDARCQQATSELNNRFLDYTNHEVQEKVFVHSDREFYLTGELIWLSLFIVNSANHEPINLSKVAYIEILDKDNNPVIQTKISCEDGFGDGSLFIPATLSSGNYTIRAYTRWMRNFDTEFYFSKTISIVNPFKQLPNITSSDKTTYDFQIFPEGGNLVQGLKSKVAYRAVDNSGKGISFQGSVLNQLGDTLVQFSPYKFGIGSFFLTPETDMKYTLVLSDTLGNAIYSSAIEGIRSSGYVIYLEELASQLKVTVASKNNYDKELTLFAHTRNDIKKIDITQVLNDNFIFLIEKDSLGDGISHFTVFNQNNQPLVERLYFKYPKNQLSIQLSSIDETYDSRSKVSIDVDVSSSKSNSSNFSMSVYRIDSLQNTPTPKINEYLLLTSDLRGIVECPSYYFNQSPEVKIATDNLMLTHGWRRFQWGNIINKKYEKYRFIPEFNGQLIESEIVNTVSGNPAANMATYLSIPGKKLIFKNSISNSNGLSLFELNDFYGKGNLIIRADQKGNNSYSMNLKSSYSKEYTKNALSPIHLSSKTENKLISRSINMQLNNKYHINGNFSSPKIDSLPFYSNPDEHYLLDDYTRFPTLNEVLTEYVRSVRLRKRADDYNLTVFVDAIDNYGSNPLVLLDGVRVSDVNKLMKIDPLKIEHIDVVTHDYSYGPKTYTGIVNFTTYNHDLAAHEIDQPYINTPFEGIQFHREYFSPKYESKNEKLNNLPDFRDLLFWKPNVKCNFNGKGQVEFFTSDQDGTYNIVINALSIDGLSGTKTVSFKVANK